MDGGLSVFPFPVPLNSISRLPCGSPLNGVAFCLSVFPLQLTSIPHLPCCSTLEGQAFRLPVFPVPINSISRLPCGPPLNGSFLFPIFKYEKAPASVSRCGGRCFEFRELNSLLLRLEPIRPASRHPSRCWSDDRFQRRARSASNRREYRCPRIPYRGSCRRYRRG